MQFSPTDGRILKSRFKIYEMVLALEWQAGIKSLDVACKQPRMAGNTL